MFINLVVCVLLRLPAMLDTYQHLLVEWVWTSSIWYDAP